MHRFHGNDHIDRSKILQPSEIKTILTDLKQRAQTSVNARVSLILFRLSCCCGLRRCEIHGLNIRDVILEGPRPHIIVPKTITKGPRELRKKRKVPLWWDKGTYEDIKSWIEFLDLPGDMPVIITVLPRVIGKRPWHGGLCKRWNACMKVLGPERAKQLTIHCGRHTFISHALNAGRSLAEVRDAAGHSSIAMTSKYIHALESEDTPDVFGF